MVFLTDRSGSYAASNERWVRQKRRKSGKKPVFKRVDTCAAEFESYTPYLYSTYEEECEAEPTERRKMMILGSGPNRIGQGIEFDYCCCQAAFTSPRSRNRKHHGQLQSRDRLHRLRHLRSSLLRAAYAGRCLHIVDIEKPEAAIVQFGGQTPLKLARDSWKRKVYQILGTSPESIDVAEDRRRFSRLLDRFGYPSAGERHCAFARRGASSGARSGLSHFGPTLVCARWTGHGDRLRQRRISKDTFGKPSRPRPTIPFTWTDFLEDAFEVDVDAISDGEES